MPPINNFKRNCLSVAIGQAILFHTVVPSVAQAATVTVDTTSDVGNAAGCSLRDAISLTNNGAFINNGCVVNGNAFGTNDQINFDLPSDSTINLQQGKLLINTTVSINGPGAEQLTIDGNNASRVFEFNGAYDSVVDGLTIANGHGFIVDNSDGMTISNSTISGHSAGRGGIQVERSDSVTISNNTIQGNSAYFGGGIYIHLSDEIIISNSTINGNLADSGGGIYFLESESLVISNSKINNNEGGGIVLFASDEIKITESDISSNTTKYRGGGIYISSDNVSIEATTISRNLSRGGGGISVDYNQGIQIVNSTISSNTAITYDDGRGGKGGGIYSTGYAELRLYASTINDNKALAAGVSGGGIYASDNADVNLYLNNVVSNSVGGDCNRAIESFSIAGRRINWSEDGSCLIGSASGNGDPLLGPLRDNGGSTLTHAPLAGSGLINAFLLPCTNAPINGVDQRGESRASSGCFMGAVEGIQEEEDETSFYIIPLSNGKTAVVPL